MTSLPQHLEKQIQQILEMPSQLDYQAGGCWMPDTLWYMKLPVSWGAVDGADASREFRRACMQALIDARDALELIVRGRSDSALPFAVVIPPHLFQSELLIFPNADAFEDYVQHDSGDLIWSRLLPDRSLIGEWELASAVAERGFHVRFEDEDEVKHSEIWFVGDIN